MSLCEATSMQLARASERKARIERMAVHAKPDPGINLRRDRERAAAVVPAAAKPKRTLAVLEPQPAPPPPPQAIPAPLLDKAFVPVRAIQLATLAHYHARGIDIRLRDILSPRRNADVVRPRHVAIYLCKILTILSSPAIGRRFGNLDHTTVLHAVRKMERMLPEIADDVAGIIALLRARGFDVGEVDHEPGL